LSLVPKDLAVVLVHKVFKDLLEQAHKACKELKVYKDQQLKEFRD
jgi:hypothetical protein